MIATYRSINAPNGVYVVREAWSDEARTTLLGISSLQPVKFGRMFVKVEEGFLFDDVPPSFPASEFIAEGGQLC